MGGIDSFFDQVENVLDAFSGAPAPAPAPSARPPARSAAATAVVPDRRKLAGGTAIAAQEYRIVESIDATTGRTAWVVTNGRDRAECSSSELAARVRAALG